MDGTYRFRLAGILVPLDSFEEGCRPGTKHLSTVVWVVAWLCSASCAYVVVSSLTRVIAERGTTTDLPRSTGVSIQSVNLPLFKS